MERLLINRDISWLAFNKRVLDEAADRGNPLLERLNFIAICSSNADEFCMVRFAGMLRHSDADSATESTRELCAAVKRELNSLARRQHHLLYDEILPELESRGIRIADRDSLSEEQRRTARSLMEQSIYPVLSPIAVDSSHPFPLVPNLVPQLLVRLVPEGREEEFFALLSIPSGLPRFIELSDGNGGTDYLPTEELIRHRLPLLFAGADIRECAAFRITRDSDLSLDEEGISDLFSELKSALHRTRKRDIIRVEYESSMSRSARRWLLKQLKPHPDALLCPIRGLLNLKSLFQIAGASGHPELHNIPQPPLPHPLLGTLRGEELFRCIREHGPLLLHHPFHSFAPVIALLDSAASDPEVLAIKQTLYRVSGDSPIVHALMRAARCGKQVLVLVELKARFDEANNMNWARELEEAGAHVVYGIAKLKVHCKALLIIRREADGIHRYLHLGTGNYNDKTARLYTDLGYISDDPLLAQDVSALFNVISGFSVPPVWNKLLVAPFTLLERMLYLIDREAACSGPENPGHIRIKVNSLCDEEVIEHLYRAAEHHVCIELIVRGICSLSPAALPPEAAERIRIVSILDRYLEHTRIYHFANNGAPEYYIGSADLMPRNLRRRIETLFPIEDASLRQELDYILNCSLNDRRKGHVVTGYNQYSKARHPERYEESRSQTRLYAHYREQNRRAESESADTLTVYRPAANEEEEF